MNALPRTLWLITLGHFLVDAYASSIQPLWPDLQQSLALDEAGIQWAYLGWSLASSITQLAFGYWGDRARGHWLIWFGPGVGVICLSSLGWASTFPALCAMLVAGGLGIAAFHPEAAAMAGASSPGQRSRAMSVFAVGGYLGQAVGPIYSGLITTHFPMRTLIWGLTWGLAGVALLGWSLRSAPDDGATSSTRDPIALTELLRGRGVSVLLVLAIGILRVLPALGVPMALAYVLKGRGASNEQIGVVQSVFLGSVGLGSLACAVFAQRANERKVLWTFPLLATPMLIACPATGGSVLVVLVGSAGCLLGATLPILVSYGQRLLPEGQRVASSITMGVTWGLGGAVVAGTMTLCNRALRPDVAFLVFAAGAFASSVLCAWLPELERTDEIRQPLRKRIPDEVSF